MAVVLAPALIAGFAVLATAGSGDAGVDQVAQVAERPGNVLADELFPLPTPSPTATPKPVKPATELKSRSGPTGRYRVAPGKDAPPAGKGKVVRYLVEVEEGLRATPEKFAADVHRILNDARGWGRGGATLRFARVDSGKVRFRVSLSSPSLTDKQCHPLRTFSRVSCFNGRRAVINNVRWQHGSWTYGKDVASYREYVINHEVGHALGRGHVRCRGKGKPAHVMVQQTKSLQGCVANPWPHASARAKENAR